METQRHRAFFETITREAIPVGRATSRLAHFLDNRLTDGGEDIGLRRRPVGRSPKEDSVYSFPLEAELTPGAQCDWGGGIRSVEKAKPQILG
jgi:hypothetical protein